MLQREPARELARGKWHGLLGKWLDARAIAGRHTACPMCGGKDRFRLDDKDGSGSWICSHCGAGDGLYLLQNLAGFTFPEAADYVERECGKIVQKPIKAGRSPEEVRAELRRVWSESKRIESTDPVGIYLTKRCGITDFPPSLRYHPALSYHAEDGSVSKHPAMLAQAVGADGASLTIHRTYLSADGQKASVPTARKMMPPIRKLENATVRLAEPADGWIGVGEGIETTFCAAAIHKIPAWACMTAGLLKTFRPPDGVKFVAIFGDNDHSFTGQAVAYELARTLTQAGIEARVFVPEIDGQDWADVWAEKGKACHP